MTDQDIVTILRSTVVWEPHVGKLLDAAADEIARLRGDAEIASLRLEAAHAELARLLERL